MLITQSVSIKVTITAPRDEHVSETIQAMPRRRIKFFFRISVLKIRCFVFAWFWVSGATGRQAETIGTEICSVSISDSRIQFRIPELFP